jgi:hypothetical protein
MARFGLSYGGPFRYADLALNATSIGHCERVGVGVSVTNTGEASPGRQVCHFGRK